MFMGQLSRLDWLKAVAPIDDWRIFCETPFFVERLMAKRMGTFLDLSNESYCSLVLITEGSSPFRPLYWNNQSLEGENVDGELYHPRCYANKKNKKHVELEH